MSTASLTEWTLALLVGLSAIFLGWAVFASLNNRRGEPGSLASAQDGRGAMLAPDEAGGRVGLSRWVSGIAFWLLLDVAAAMLVWWTTGNLLLAVILAVALLIGPRWVRRAQQQRSLRLYDEQWPDCLMMIAGGMRAGLSLTGAMSQVVSDLQYPMSREIGKVLRDQRLGSPLNKALQSLAQRMPTPTTMLVTSVMAIANDTGGSLSDTLEHTSQTARRQLETAAKIDALTSQGRMQALVIGAMPMLLLLVLTRLEGDTMRLLWTTPIGLAVCALIVVLEVCGVLMIRRIANIDF